MERGICLSLMCSIWRITFFLKPLLVNKVANFSKALHCHRFGPRDVIGHVTIWPAVGGSYYSGWFIDTNTLCRIVIEILRAPSWTQFRGVWGEHGVMPFFGKAPLAAVEGRRVIYHHNRSTGVDTAVYRPSHWKCIRNGKNWVKMGKIVEDSIGFRPLTNSILVFQPQTIKRP